jgi:hypothetical protein
MKRWSAIAVSWLFVGLMALGCTTDAAAPGKAGADGWITLFDGTERSLAANWHPIGDANWKIVDGAVQASAGNGFLVSNATFSNFQIRAEFWVDGPANSGVFIRCSDPLKVTATNAYEVNIFDARPDPSYGTGAIVNVAKVNPMPKAANKWNTYEITANGRVFTVTLNGQRTVDGAENGQHALGRIALQYGAGVVKFRLVQIKPI